MRSLNTKQIKFSGIRVQLSQKKGAKFKHNLIDRCPTLTYHFNRGSNWKATDVRVKNQWNEISSWIQEYWNFEFQKDESNHEAYQKELLKEIKNTIDRVNSHWEKKFESDFEKNFEDPIVKFINRSKASSLNK